jgi:hypothetical protein
MAALQFRSMAEKIYPHSVLVSILNTGRRIPRHPVLRLSEIQTSNPTAMRETQSPDKKHQQITNPKAGKKVKGAHVENGDACVDVGCVWGSSVEAIPAHPQHARAGQNKDDVVGDEALTVPQQTGAQLQRETRCEKSGQKQSSYFKTRIRARFGDQIWGVL